MEKDLDFTGNIKGKLEDALTGAGDGGAAGEVERLGSVVEAAEETLPGDGDGFADSTAELAELAGSFRQT